MTGSGANSARQSLVRVLNHRVYSTPLKTIRENDVVFVRDAVRGRKAKTVFRSRLTKPLAPKSDIQMFQGQLWGKDLIGRRVFDEIPLRPGRNAEPSPRAGTVTLHEPSLAAYIVHQPRLTTPIYPQDATLIVSLLDIGLPVPGEDPEADAGPPFEIFEAGTGAGSLTLHLARAIHGANPAVPPHLRQELCTAPYMTTAEILLSDTPPSDPHPFKFADQTLQEDMDAYRSSRRAVIHTLDISAEHSRGAHGLIRDFRRAQYLLDVEFHVGSIAQYLRKRLAETGGQPFLAHSILDLPNPKPDAAAVVDALRPDGLLLVFQPSITQVAEVVAWARSTAQPLRLELAIELPLAVDKSRDLLDGTGGREWDIRVVESTDKATSVREGSATVCRPKVGGTIGGGGFVAVFRKLPPLRREEQSEEEEGITQ